MDYVSLVIHNFLILEENKPKRPNAIKAKPSKSIKKLKNKNSSVIRNPKVVLQSNTFKKADSQQCFIINGIPSTTVSLSTTTGINLMKMFIIN